VQSTELLDLRVSDGDCKADNPTQAVNKHLWVRSFRGLYSSDLTPAFLPSTSNYVGSRGMIDAGCPGSGSSPNWVPNKDICDSNGIFFGDSQISNRQITDGTSKTFIIGERDAYCQSATWIGARNPPNGSEMHSSLWAMAHVTNSITLNYPSTLGYNTCTEGFSSAHPGGAFFAFCDGSVRWIDDDVSFDQALNSPTCTASKTSALRCRPQIGTRVIGVYQRMAWRDDEVPID
jgi:prepilin-type processing-associated H-X9-DG protein